MRRFFQRQGRRKLSAEGAGETAVTRFPGRRDRNAAVQRREADKFAEDIKAGVRFATRSYVARIDESGEGLSAAKAGEDFAAPARAFEVRQTG